MQFNETKPLHERFDDEFPDRGFDVKVFNKSNFVAMRGPGCNKGRISAMTNEQAKTRRQDETKV